MTTGVIRTQGTELFWVDASVTGGGSSDPELLKVDCATAISGLGGARDQIDSSCLDTTGDKEFLPGLGNPGQVTVGVNFIPTSTPHASLLQMKEDGTTVNWIIALSNGSADPSVDSDGNIVAPTNGRSYFRFAGFVSDFNIDIAGNEIVRATLQIQRSGTATFYKNGAV